MPSDVEFVRRSQRQQDRDRVVLTGIGIDDDPALHEALLVAQDRVRPVGLGERLHFVGVELEVERLHRIVEMGSLLAPMIGAVTPGCASSQASATCALGTPRFLAISVTRSMTRDRPRRGR